MRRYRVFLGLGSNIGERYRMLQLAAGALGVLQGTRLVQASPVYETDPFGKTDQGRFLNAALEGSVREVSAVTTGSRVRKGDRTPEEANMGLRRQPGRPNYLAFLLLSGTGSRDVWNKYAFAE